MIIKLQDTQLQDTQLQDTQIEDTQIEHTQLQDTQIEDTQIEDTQLQDTQLQDTQMKSGYIQKKNLKKARQALQGYKLLLRVLCHFTGFARLLLGRSECSPSFLIQKYSIFFSNWAERALRFISKRSSKACSVAQHPQPC